jgi:hypothetical protein
VLTFSSGVALCPNLIRGYQENQSHRGFAGIGYWDFDLSYANEFEGFISDRSSGFEPVGREFESLWAHQT